MADILRCLMIEKRLVEIRQTQKLLADAEKAGNLPASQIFVEQVADLSEAWSHLQAETFDLVFLELALPGEAGLEALAELRQKAPFLPIIVICRSTDRDTAQQALALGAVDILCLEQANPHRLALAVRRARQAGHLQLRLRADQERLEWLEGSMAEAVWLARADLRFVEVSHSIGPLTGFSVQEILRLTLFDLLAEPSRQAVRNLLKEKKPGLHPLEVQHYRKDGSLFWAEIMFSTRKSGLDGPAFWHGITREGSEKHVLRERLEYLAMHDELTGLFNRAYFQEELTRLEFSRMHPISVLYAALEEEKTAGAYDLQAMDDLAKRAAVLLRQAFRVEDLVARISTTEFVAIMPQTHSGAAGRAVQRVVNLMDQENLHHPQHPLYLSVGVATAETGQSLSKILKAVEPKKLSS